MIYNIINMKQPLDLEIKTYEEQKEKLLAEAKDKFVLIKGSKIIDIYASQDDALSEGYKKFGNNEFLVKQVSDIEPVNYFSRAVV